MFDFSQISLHFPKNEQIIEFKKNLRKTSSPKELEIRFASKGTMLEIKDKVTQGLPHAYYFSSYLLVKGVEECVLLPQL